MCSTPSPVNPSPWRCSKKRCLPSKMRAVEVHEAVLLCFEDLCAVTHQQLCHLPVVPSHCILGKHAIQVSMQISNYRGVRRMPAHSSGMQLGFQCMSAVTSGVQYCAALPIYLALASCKLLTDI